MLEEAPRVAEVLALLLAGLGAAIIGYSILFRRNILILALGAVIAATALMAPMLLRGSPVSVMVIKQNGSEIEVIDRSGFYDGHYRTRNGNRLAIERQRQWGRTATVVINDSDRFVSMKSYQYSDILGASGRPELLSYLLPMEYRVFPRRIAFTGDDVTGPPKTIESETVVGGIIFLAWSRVPYDPKIHGDAAELNEKLEVPQLTER